MTSAPKSASVWVQAGPATTRVKSTTSRPSRAVGAPCIRGARSGNGKLAVMVRHSLLIWLAHPVTRCAFKVYSSPYTTAASLQHCHAGMCRPHGSTRNGERERFGRQFEIAAADRCGLQHNRDGFVRRLAELQCRSPPKASTSCATARPTGTHRAVFRVTPTFL